MRRAPQGNRPPYCPSNFRTLPRRRSNSTGLVSNSSQPAASAFSREPASAWADERDDRDGARLRVGLEPARRLPAVDDRKLQVHEDQVRLLLGGHRAAALAVLRHQHLVLVGELEAHLEHVDVVVVVFDVEDPGHDAPDGPGGSVLHSSGRDWAVRPHQPADAINQFRRLEHVLHQHRFDARIEPRTIRRRQIHGGDDDDRNVAPLRPPFARPPPAGIHPSPAS